MNNLFTKTSSYWVRYSEYEYRQSDNGVLYITPVKNAKPSLYDPLKNAEDMVLEALNIGRLAMGKPTYEKLKQEVLDFIKKYGLLGFMTALPTTPDFMDYDAVYLLKNHFIKEETMSTQNYTKLYFPFDKPDFQKDEKTARWNITNDRDMIALAMTMSDKPMALNMSLGRDYAERYDWLVQQFKDWAFITCASYFYYCDYDTDDEYTRNLHRQAVAVFGGIAPTYHIALYDKPTIVWDFHSLLLGIQMMFSFMLTDEAKPLNICRNCHKVFMRSHPNAVFCGARCKNQFNVYKSREKNKPN